MSSVTGTLKREPLNKLI